MLAMCAAGLLGVNACFAVYDISVAFLHSQDGRRSLCAQSPGRSAGEARVLLATTTSNERDAQGEQVVG